MADWRFRAKCVALFDMVFSLIELVLLIVAFVDTFDLKKQMKDFTNDQTISEVMSILWVFLGIAILFSFVQLFAAMKLNHATEVGRDPLEASKTAMLWQIVTLIYIVLAIVGCLLAIASGIKYISTMVDIFVRGMFLCIVHKFTTELETETGTPRMWRIC